MPHPLSITDEVIDRPAGLLSVPVVRRRLARRQRDDLLALLLLAISACGSLGGIALWIAGHGMLGLRVACGAVLAILGMLVF